MGENIGETAIGRCECPHCHQEVWAVVKNVPGDVATDRDKPLVSLREIDGVPRTFDAAYSFGPRGTGYNCSDCSFSKQLNNPELVACEFSRLAKGIPYIPLCEPACILFQKK